MSEEAKQVISFIFKRSGKKILPASDVYLAISMELQWCSPKQAKRFVKQSIDQGFLSEKDEGVAPSFPIENISIPTGFTPSNECFTNINSKDTNSKADDVISLVISKIKQKSKLSDEEIKNEIEKIASKNLLSAEVAAVFFAKKMRCETKQLIEKINTTDFTSEKSTS